MKTKYLKIKFSLKAIRLVCSERQKNKQNCYINNKYYFLIKVNKSQIVAKLTKIKNKLELFLA